MGEMDFKSNISESFNKIKQDIKKIDTKTLNNSEQIKLFVEKFTFLQASIQNLNNKVDKIFEKVSVISGEGIINSRGNGPSIIGKSSIRSGASIVVSSSNFGEKGDPFVSHGTSSKKIPETKRSIKIKNMILNNGDSYINELFHRFVVEEEICSKTSFYRFIKELNDEGHINVGLANGKRKIKVKGKL